MIRTVRYLALKSCARSVALTTLLGLAGCAMTENITITNYTYTPFVFHDIEYEHPVDAVYLGNRIYPDYQYHSAYVYMSNIERLEVDHYLRSLNHCYSGNWFIEGYNQYGSTVIEGDNGRRCDAVMGVYRDLYKQGYRWESIGDVIAQGPFFDLLAIEDKCKKTKRGLVGKLSSSGHAQFHCGSD
ncbi:MAG: hypothetical protein COB26_00095 [Piscirickettsiaceae bacterium]|nr:MAG: hypothetical protein COB26_05020 [Piscirickettsiaceae bacterium]PCI72459.1 MAG: hypothetical protein COB26_00095 [Piscirickettsiaceae bacterium]